MNCLECQEMLQQRLDGAARADRTALDCHLAACVECRERHAAAALLLEGLRQLPHPQPAPDLASRTAARVRRDRRTRLGRRRLWAGFALAASVLVAVAGYLWLNPARTEISTAKNTPPKVKAPAPAKAEPSLRQSLDEAREGLAALAGRFANKTGEEIRVLQGSASAFEFVSHDSMPRMAPLTQPLDTTAEGLRQGSRGASVGTRVVGSSARRAFNYFLRKMPPLQTPAKRMNQKS